MPALSHRQVDSSKVVPSELSKQLRKVKRPGRPRSEPLWRGPEEDGITYSLLSRFLVCRERFRLLVIEGLKGQEKWVSTFGYGNMWHAMEEAKAAGKDPQKALLQHTTEACRRFRFQAKEINEWHEKAKVEFPAYASYWQQHAHEVKREPVFQEEEFAVPITLPSGRRVKLRGKWDSVDFVPDKVRPGLWIQENKTKSSIDQGRISRQLRFDLQTMIYVCALRGLQRMNPASPALHVNAPIVGVRYNAVRRAAHKTAESMMEKMAKDFKAKRHAEWFARWNVIISERDVTRFESTCLHPILETLVQWHDWVVTGSCDAEVMARNCNWTHPFGVYNVLDEGGSTDLDEYLESGSEVGLQRVDDLFPELRKVA